ncbi:SDR family oxidoreductase [Hoeflea alexandrii]|uniref:SDR family oxidoreductase n=1 Tax=Hoeflea alexandrii TaxID=288436 RepID=UPI0022AE630F|nr:SDR family NAD(P)-dependent oxidoreductase [Hoeflea alexandrii]MCZ4291016.1 SDR family NAD(P)-dependent oxidoreductase [Hoeflea alexandrii]
MSIQRSALIIAAAQGIGLATAKRMAASGYSLTLMDINGAKLEHEAELLREAGTRVETVVGDALDSDTLRGAVERTTGAFGRLDALACIAGGSGGIPMHQVDEIPPEQWMKVLLLNINSVYLACHHAVPVMRDQKYGRICCLSSTVAKGRLGPIGTMGARLPYATAKAGLIGFVKQLSKDVGIHGITANAVLPWLTIGEPGTTVRETFLKLPQDYKDKTLAMSPQGRPIEAEGVAAAIAFLLSEEAGYVSGVELPVDGGVLN